MIPLGVFFRDKGIFVFLPGGQCHACDAYAYIQKIPYFQAVFDKDHLLSFSGQRKNTIFSGKKKYHVSRYYKKDRVQGWISWKDHILRKFKENIIFPGVFFWERSSFPLFLKNKIKFLGKRNIIFPDNTRKIKFQCDFFGKTIFSKHLKKENMVFRAVLLVLCYPYHLVFICILVYLVIAFSLRLKFVKIVFNILFFAGLYFALH